MAKIFIEKKGTIYKTNLKFESKEKLYEALVRMGVEGTQYPGAQNCESPVSVQAAQESESVATTEPAVSQGPEPIESGVPADQLHKRLNLIKPNDR